MPSSPVRTLAALAALTALLIVSPGALAGAPKSASLTKADWSELIAAHSRGGGKGVRVRIIEFTDFQCPFCKRVNPTLDGLLEQYGGQVEHVSLHHPLGFHKMARPAALAAVAAARQGRFWDMHDELFLLGRHLSEEKIDAAAEMLGLDMKRYAWDRDADVTAAFVDRTMATALATGMRGTPAFWINGQKLTGAQPITKFQEVIDAEIAASIGARKRGPTWIASRTRDNHADLAAYMAFQREPKAADAPKRADAANPRAGKGPADDPTIWKVTLPADAPTRGNPDGLVTLAVFSEYQCPFCKRVEPAFNELLEANPELRLVFLNNPLSFHKRAMPAALAAMCARDQGKFWPMHELLFANQTALEDDDLIGYARQIGVDMATWGGCFMEKKHQARIEADQALARRVTARGTPTSFINGRRVTGARPAADFQAVIDQELARAKELLKGGTPRKKVYSKAIATGKVFGVLGETVHSFDAKGSPRLGSMGAPVTLVVFHDYECPFCARADDPIQKVQMHYGKKVTVVYKQFPLSFHKQARLAAAASLCALEQQIFEPVHQGMYAQQKRLHQADLVDLATRSGGNARAFERCVTSGRYDKVIDRDMAEGAKAGVRGTPTVFLNGREFSSQYGLNEQSIRDAIDKHILKEDR